MSDTKYLSELVLRDAILYSFLKQGKLLLVNCGEYCLSEWDFDNVEEVSKDGKKVEVCVVEGLTIASVDNVTHPVSAWLKNYFLSFDAVIYAIPAETVHDESVEQLANRFSDVAEKDCAYPIFAILVDDPCEQLCCGEIFAKFDFKNAPQDWRFYVLPYWNQLYILPAMNFTLDALNAKFRDQLRYKQKKERREYRAKWQWACDAAEASNNMNDPEDESEDQDQARYAGVFYTRESHFDLDHCPTPSPPSEDDCVIGLVR